MKNKLLISVSLLFPTIFNIYTSHPPPSPNNRVSQKKLNKICSQIFPVDMETCWIFLGTPYSTYLPSPPLPFSILTLSPFLISTLLPLIISLTFCLFAGKFYNLMFRYNEQQNMLVQYYYRKSLERNSFFLTKVGWYLNNGWRGFSYLDAAIIQFAFYLLFVGPFLNNCEPLSQPPSTS